MADSQEAEEIREVIADAARDYYHPLRLHYGPLRHGCSAYVQEMLSFPLDDTIGETMEQRLMTAMMLAFMAGREHKARGYISPVPKDQPVDEIDDARAEMIERMTDTD